MSTYKKISFPLSPNQKDVFDKEQAKKIKYLLTRRRRGNIKNMAENETTLRKNHLEGPYGKAARDFPKPFDPEYSFPGLKSPDSRYHLTPEGYQTNDDNNLPKILRRKFMPMSELLNGLTPEQVKVLADSLNAISQPQKPSVVENIERDMRKRRSTKKGIPPIK